MTAALAAAHPGASVVVLEKTGHMARGNTVLRRAGVADTPSLQGYRP
jgi:succinate dehydrogenase/fumarate reductase flavoprotein subunit